MTASDPLGALLRLSTAESGVAELLLLPDPTGEPTNAAQAEVALPRLFALLGTIVHRQVSAYEGSNKAGTYPESIDWSQAYRKAVAFIIWLLNNEEVLEWFLARNKEQATPAVAVMSLIGSPEEPGLPEILQLERAPIFAFSQGLIFSRAFSLSNSALDSVMPVRMDHIVLNLISALTMPQGEDPEHLRAAMAMANFLSSASKYYGGKREERQKERLRATATSLLQAHELPFLARRDGPMLERYGGTNKVAARFEQQLNLAFQSLGLLTASTVPGKRRVDIVCINPGTPATSPTAILVEAKTSKDPYRLPVDDERALKEYAERIKRSRLRFPFDLQLILIVGQMPHKTLEDRLRALEIATQTPVRYCSASTLAGYLVDRPIPLPADDFIQSILKADRIVSKEVLFAASSKTAEELAAWTTLINTVLQY